MPYAEVAPEARVRANVLVVDDHALLNGIART